VYEVFAITGTAVLDAGGTAAMDVGEAGLSEANTLERADIEVARGAQMAADGGTFESLPSAGRIPDEALVVRGGPNTARQISNKIEVGGGVRGVSAQAKAMPGLTREEAVEALVRAGRIPHDDIAFTTVSEIRAAGGDVIRTPGIGYHCTIVCGPGGISPEDLSALFAKNLRANPVSEAERAIWSTW
jgi:hypothetical protein